MAKPSRINVTDDYIKIRIEEPKLFDDDSFRMVEVSDDGVSAVVGYKDEVSLIQSYIFDKSKGWDVDKAKKWLEENATVLYRSSRVLNNILYMQSSLKFVQHPVNLMSKEKPVALAANNFDKATLNDKYYFYTEGVHEGANLNKAYFFRDELMGAYKSAAQQAIDFEHRRDEIIGSSLDAQLVESEDGRLAIGANNVLWRLSPFMSIEYDGGITRDELIRQKYFENKLAVSMECTFDELKCTKCGYQTNDYLDFENHLYLNHNNEPDNFYGMVGVDFIGWGITFTPADPDAQVYHLRTSDDGALADSIEASFKEKHGTLSENVFLAKACAHSNPDMNKVDGKIVLFSSKNEEKSEKNEKKCEKNHKESTQTNVTSDKHSEKQVSRNNLGGTIMFKLAEKTKKADTLSDIFVIAQTVLKDYMGENTLTDEERQAFASELSEVVLAHMSGEFSLDVIYEVTKQQKADAIATAREEEKTAADSKIGEVVAEKEKLETQLTEAKASIEEFEKKEEDRLIQDKIEEFVASIEKKNINLTSALRETVVEMVKQKITNGEEDKLDDLRKSIVALATKKTLENDSETMRNLSAGGDEPESFADRMKKLRQQYKEDK